MPISVGNLKYFSAILVLLIPSKSCNFACCDSSTFGLYAHVFKKDNKVFWYPENYKNKSIINEEPVALSLQAEGYYCDECMTAFASFQKKEYGNFERLLYKIFDKEY